MARLPITSIGGHRCDIAYCTIEPLCLGWECRQRWNSVYLSFLSFMKYQGDNLEYGDRGIHTESKSECMH